MDYAGVTVERIEITPEGVVIHYFVGETHYLRELRGTTKAKEKILVSLVEDPSNISKSNKGLVDLTRPASKPLLKYRSENSLVTSSNSLTIGAAGEIRTPDTLVRSQALYPAELRPHLEIFKKDYSLILREFASSLRGASPSEGNFSANNSPHLWRAFEKPSIHFPWRN